VFTDNSKGSCYQVQLIFPTVLKGFYKLELTLIAPITVAALSEARTFFARSNAAIVGSSPTQGMVVCVRSFCVCVVLCVGSGLATG
jgi:hypothetical protein